MFKKILVPTALVFVCLLGLMLAGCSDNQIISDGPDSTGDVDAWFPVEEGYATTYQVDYSTGVSEVVTFEIGEEVAFGARTATEWIISSSTSGSSTSYLMVSGDEVIFYENSRANAETILSMPLSPGSAWDRFTISGGTDPDTDTSIVTGFGDGYDDKLGGGLPEDNGQNGTAEKNFPITGGNQVTVEGVETVGLGNGMTFGGAVRLRNEGSAGKCNYYWYAPGVGLVKYVLGATGDDCSQGEVVGQLLTYGK